MSYAIFFDFENKTYRLPVNPEELSISNEMQTEEYDVLKLGKVSVPSSRNLIKINFETEIPNQNYFYVNTGDGFKGAEEYESLFNSIMESKKPVRFIASNGITRDINMLVLISFKTVEKSGEEGDKYYEFELTEYRPYDKKKMAVTPVNKSNSNVLVKKEEATNKVNPNKPKEYTVKSGDTLWSIAKMMYGDGNQYNKIVDANKNSVKNPNLIYPKQKLVIP